MSSNTNTQKMFQPQIHITDCSTNIVNNITIQNFNIAERLQPLTDGQKSFLGAHYQEQKASTLADFQEDMHNN